MYSCVRGDCRSNDRCRSLTVHTGVRCDFGIRGSAGLIPKLIPVRSFSLGLGRRIRLSNQLLGPRIDISSGAPSCALQNSARPNRVKVSRSVPRRVRSGKCSILYFGSYQKTKRNSVSASKNLQLLCAAACPKPKCPPKDPLTSNPQVVRSSRTRRTI